MLSDSVSMLSLQNDTEKRMAILELQEPRHKARTIVASAIDFHCRVKSKKRSQRYGCVGPSISRKTARPILATLQPKRPPAELNDIPPRRQTIHVAPPEDRQVVAGLRGNERARPGRIWDRTHRYCTRQSRTATRRQQTLRRSSQRIPGDIQYRERPKSRTRAGHRACQGTGILYGDGQFDRKTWLL
jgi:hypothetical protein